MAFREARERAATEGVREMNMKMLIAAAVLLAGCPSTNFWSLRKDSSVSAPRATPGQEVLRDAFCTFSVGPVENTPHDQLKTIQTNLQTYSLEQAVTQCSLFAPGKERFWSCASTCFTQVLYYNGSSKGTFRFNYREFSEGTVRPLFDADYEWDVGASTIAFRDKRWKVEKIDSESISLSPLPAKP